jgi:acyl-CoA dehydrogenase
MRISSTGAWVDAVTQAGNAGQTSAEWVYREVKVMMICGGPEEIMKELAAKQLGI